MERKVFMGVAQLLLDDLDLVNMVIGWYKLFTSASLVTRSQTINAPQVALPPPPAPIGIGAPNPYNTMVQVNNVSPLGTVGIPSTSPAHIS